MTAMADRIASLAESRALAQGLTLLLVAVCVVLAARLLWLVVAGPSLPAPPPASPGERAAAAASTGSIQGLFGPAGTPTPTAASAPASRSGLVLRGTVAAADATLGVAFVAEGDAATERAYRAGDSLPGGARLREVHADRVLIERGGTLETLALSRMGAGTAAAAGPPPSARPAPARGSAATDAMQASGGYLSAPINVGRPDLATARQVRAPDLASLVAEANIVPVLEGERVIGVRLRLPDPALLERLGLSAQDVITQVNGIPLDGVERRGELEQSLQRGGPVQLTVRRDGIDRQLTIGL